MWDFWNPHGGDVREPNKHGRNQGALNRRLAYGIWRAQKYPPDHPALAERQLEPISPQPRSGSCCRRPRKSTDPE